MFNHHSIACVPKKENLRRSHSTDETCKDVRVRRDAGDSWFDSISDIFSFL